jgi:hypothetical protein
MTNRNSALSVHKKQKTNDVCFIIPVSARLAAQRPCPIIPRGRVCCQLHNPFLSFLHVIGDLLHYRFTRCCYLAVLAIALLGTEVAHACIGVPLVKKCSATIAATIAFGRNRYHYLKFGRLGLHICFVVLFILWVLRVAHPVVWVSQQ